MGIMQRYVSIFEQLKISDNVISDRDYAGVYINGDIIVGKEHFPMMGYILSGDNAEIEKNKISFLHFFKNNDLLVCFIDNLTFFSQDPIEYVVQAVVKQCPDVGEIYLYGSLDKIQLLYCRH